MQRKFSDLSKRTILVKNIINGLDAHNPEIKSTFYTRQCGETKERDEAIVAAFFEGVRRDSQQIEILNKIPTENIFHTRVDFNDLRNIRGITVKNITIKNIIQKTHLMVKCVFTFSSIPNR